MTVQIDKIALAFAHLGQICQATSDAEIIALIDSAADNIAEDCIIKCDEVDPAADLKKIRFSLGRKNYIQSQDFFIFEHAENSINPDNFLLFYIRHC